MDSQRVGRFSLFADIVYSDDALEIFKQLKLIPLRVELMSYGDIFHYVGISPLFAEVAEGGVAPEYVINVKEMGTDKGKVIAVSVEPI